MNEKLKIEKIFTKDVNNSEMLRQSLESKEVDKSMIPILKKFFSLPITPRESCYGHAKESMDPYLSYVEDDARNERDKNFQKSFKEKIAGLTDVINRKIGSEAVNIILEEIDHGGGPKDYTLRFEIIDKKISRDSIKEIIDIIWEEFCEYLDEINRNPLNLTNQ